MTAEASPRHAARRDKGQGIRAIKINVEGEFDAYELHMGDANEATWQMIGAPGLAPTSHAMYAKDERLKHLSLLVDEDAMYKQSRYNQTASIIAQRPVLGRALIVAVGLDGDNEIDIMSLPPALNRHYFKRLFRL